MTFLPAARPLVERFGAEFFRQLPGRPGVYLMCGAGDGVLYVGKAKNLRQRLGSYRSANEERLPRKILRLLITVERIYWDECPDEASAIERERELLLALRPKFNTVGTYPAPKHHLGWRRNRNHFEIGFGDATAGWERRYGEFSRIRPAYAALLRLVWWAVHPESAFERMPSRLISSRPPPIWTFPGTGPASEEMMRRFEAFLEGHSPELAEWLLSKAARGSPFEQQWRKQDAECLREFYERIHGVTLLSEPESLHYVPNT